MDKHDKNKSGFSLAETVVAMAIILIVSFTVISAAAFSHSLSVRSDAKIFFYNELDNYLQCYIADGFMTDETSSVSFLLGDYAIESDVQPQYTKHKFGYDKDCMLLKSTQNLANAVYFLEVEVGNAPKGGFFAKVVLVKKQDKPFCALPAVFYSSEDFLGGNI